MARDVARDVSGEGRDAGDGGALVNRKEKGKKQEGTKIKIGPWPVKQVMEEPLRSLGS